MQQQGTLLFRMTTIVAMVYLLWTTSTTVLAQSVGDEEHIFLPVVSSNVLSFPPVEPSVDQRRQPYPLDSGWHDGHEEGSYVAFRHEIRVADAPWLRFHFAAYALGQASQIVMTSVADGDVQRLDAEALVAWSSSSAYFNGEAVVIELEVAPGDTGVFFQVDELLVGEREQLRLAEIAAGNEVETQCGNADNRTPSTDTRVARLRRSCTAFLVSNGALMTAGHCADFGSDGTVDWTATDVIEFNVPASDTNGVPQRAAARDQFPVIPNSAVFVNGGVGNDWTVFEVQRRNQAGVNENPHTTRGFFRLAPLVPPADTNNVRITGFGVDAGTSNKTNQTQLGPYRELSGTTHRYEVDTEGGNSGSPILWNVFNQDWAIGIHTNGGCTNDTDPGTNSGTAFLLPALGDTAHRHPVRTVAGASIVYVDASAIVTPGTGFLFTPFRQVGVAEANAPVGATVSIVAGTYNESVTFNQPMVLTAPVGLVTIVGR